MYSIFLILHNLLRWFVLIFGVLAIIRAFLGWFGKKPFAALDNKLGTWFMISLDIQLLLGLLLYFVFSPVTKAAFADFGAAMANADLRYFAVEHFLMMVIATILAHVGRVLGKRAATDNGKHKFIAIFFTLAMLVILASIPWFRPLFRLG